MSCFEEVQTATQDVVIKLAHACMERYGNLKATVWYALNLTVAGCHHTDSEMNPVQSSWNNWSSKP